MSDEIRELIEWHEAEASRLADRNIPNVNLDKHQRSASALRQLMQERQWRPIETAPKDGSCFVAWSVTICDEYDEDDRIISKGNRREAPCIAYWFEMDTIAGGFLEMPHRSVSNREFTHWMPLPSPPSSFEERASATPSAPQTDQSHDTSKSESPNG